MNIFAPSPNAELSAQALDDVRLRKMNVETAQLLCTALRERHGIDGPYKNTHVHHPLVKWLDQSNANIKWLFYHGRALHRENQFRFGKDHKSGLVIESLEDIIESLEPEEMTPFVNCARNMALGLDFTHIEDVHEAYQMYLTARWHGDKKPPKWTNRGAPVWAEEFQ